MFGAVCWGVIWYPYRLMAEAGVSGVASSFYTYCIAIVFGSICFFKHRRGIFALPKSAIWLAIAAGWTNLSYVLAVIDGEVMRVMLLFYLSPLWTLLLAHFWLKEKINATGYCAIAIAILGAMLMLHDFSQAGLQWPLPKNQAEWLALSAGVGFSLTNVITRKSTHLSLAAKCMLVWVGVAAMALVVAPLVNETFVSPSFFGISKVLSMCVIAVLLVTSTFLVQYGVTKIPAVEASVLFLFELIVAAIAAYYLANEAMTWNEWLGGILIIGAGLLVTFAESKPK